jgi:glutamyl-tRNA reductase
VEEIEGVTLIHMDYLSQPTDEFRKQKKNIPAAEAIIEEIKDLSRGPKDENF